MAIRGIIMINLVEAFIMGSKNVHLIFVYKLLAQCYLILI